MVYCRSDLIYRGFCFCNIYHKSAFLLARYISLIFFPSIILIESWQLKAGIENKYSISIQYVLLKNLNKFYRNIHRISILNCSSLLSYAVPTLSSLTVEPLLDLKEFPLFVVLLLAPKTWTKTVDPFKFNFQITGS